MADAASQFREAIRDNPQDAEAHNNLGLALRALGGRDEALKHFEAALRLRPGWPVPMNEAAWILATHPDARVRNPREAVRLAEAAAEATARREPVVLDTLAAAYAADGRFDRAVAAGQEASALASAGGQAALVAQIGTRLALYRRGQPARELEPTR
jgi:Flp pilus assembly protein TadD